MIDIRSDSNIGYLGSVTVWSSSRGDHRRDWASNVTAEKHS